MRLAKTFCVILIGTILIGIGYWWGSSSQLAANEEADRFLKDVFQENAANSRGLETPGAPNTTSTPTNQIGASRQQEDQPKRAPQQQETSLPSRISSESDSLDKNASPALSKKKIEVIEQAEKMLGEGRPAELHKRIEASDRNDSWSPYMEAQLRNYLNQKPSLSVFTFPIIECRNVGCEIQGVAYSPNANQIWVNATADIYEQPWFEFKSMSASVSEFGGNRDVLGLAIIFLKEPDE